LKRALHATASGKLFLAEMPLDKVEQLMSQGVERYTERTTVSFVQLKEELKQIAAKGMRLMTRSCCRDIWRWLRLCLTPAAPWWGQ